MEVLRNCLKKHLAQYHNNQIVRKFANFCRGIYHWEKHLAQYHNNQIVRKFANFCRRIYHQYENENYDFYSNGEYDLLKELPQQDFKIIFDVGANVGNWALMTSELFPDAKIHCFEVIGETLMQLKINTQNKENIIVNEFGLLNREQELEFRYYPEQSGLSSIYYVHKHLVHDLLKGKVRVGDDYVEGNGIERIDFLKIDVEGAEHLVLEGFMKNLERGNIEAIQFEYGTVNIISKFLLYDFYKFFKKYGYVVGKIYPRYVEFREYELCHEDFIGPNFIAVRRERHDLIEIFSRQA